MGAHSSIGDQYETIKRICGNLHLVKRAEIPPSCVGGMFGGMRACFLRDYGVLCSRGECQIGR